MRALWWAVLEKHGILCIFWFLFASPFWAELFCFGWNVLLSNLRLSVDWGFILYSSSDVAGHAFFSAIGGTSVAFNKVDVAVCGTMYTFEGSHRCLLLWKDVEVTAAFCGSVRRAIAICVGRYNAFAERLDTRTWNCCHTSVCIAPYAAGTTLVLFYNVVDLTVWTLKAERISSTLCWDRGLRITCRAIKIRTNNYPTSFVRQTFLNSTSAKLVLNIFNVTPSTLALEY